MSEHKPQTHDNMTQHIVTSDSVAKSSRSKALRLLHMSKRVALTVLIIAVAGGLGLGGYTLVNNHNNANKKKDSVKTPQQIADGISSQLDQAGNSSAALKASEDKLAQLESQATSTADKEAYSLASANLYRQANQLSSALAQAQKADATYQTALSAATLAEVYRAQGDYANAAKYYGIASDRSPKTDPTERSDYNDYRLMKQDMESKL